jgi:DNA repair exonuclease SbcCD nuclease subunit
VLLGDPHLGRSFIHGVPLDRRGEREKMQFEQFHNNLLNANGELHVCMGDLFDKAVVSYSVILNTAYAYAQAADHNPRVQYVILKGNHDWQRDLEKPSAFDMFSALVHHIDNIQVVPTWYQPTGSDAVYFAWHPTISAKDMVASWPGQATKAYGHWDIEDFGGQNLNLIPTAKMAERGITSAYTGHIHKPQKFVRDGVAVEVVGSMQPYAHGEEVNEELYLTKTKEEVLAAGEGAFRDKCLRVDLSPGELLDFDIDCLQLTVRKPKGEDEKLEVTLGDFNMTSLFRDSFQEAGVSESVTEKLLGQYEASRMTDA